MYTTRTKPWVRAPPHRELKIAAPVQLWYDVTLAFAACFLVVHPMFYMSATVRLRY